MLRTEISATDRAWVDDHGRQSENIDALLFPTIGVTLATHGNGGATRRTWFGTPAELREVDVDESQTRVGDALSLAGLGELLESEIDGLRHTAEPSSLTGFERAFAADGNPVVRLGDGAGLSALGGEPVSAAGGVSRIVKIGVVELGGPEPPSMWAAPSLTLALSDDGVFVIERTPQFAALREYRGGDAATFITEACNALLRTPSAELSNWPAHAANWAARVTTDASSARLGLLECITLDTVCIATIVGLGLSLEAPDAWAEGLERLASLGLARALGGHVHTLDPMATGLVLGAMAEPAVVLESASRRTRDRITLALHDDTIVEARHLGHSHRTQFARFAIDDLATIIQETLSLWPTLDKAAEGASEPSLVPVQVIEGLGYEEADARREIWTTLSEVVEIEGIAEASLDAVTVQLGETAREGFGWLEWFSLPDGRAFEVELADESSVRLVPKTRSQILDGVLAILPGGRAWEQM